MPARVFDGSKKKRVRLDDLPTRPPAGMTKDKAAKRLAALGEEMFRLQDLLWGAKQHSMLIVLQGRDTAGKDGAIKHVAGYLNPRGVNVVSFGVPTPEEREHDFLWRIHRHAPRAGEVAIFNRSHYEDVLVVRVNDLVPRSLWKARYDHIRDFEQMLVEHGTLVLKFFLHISKEEQLERLLARETDPVAAWKVNPGDWVEREKWDAYTEAYEAVLERTSTPIAPWQVVPSDAKWYRNLVVAEAVVEALRSRAGEWTATLAARGERARLALAAYRKEHGEPSKQTGGSRGKGGRKARAR